METKKQKKKWTLAARRKYRATPLRATSAPWPPRQKKELTKKLEDFRNDRDTMEEVFENKEQIEISKYYERQPKPDLVAISEFENGELYYRRAQSANPIDINGEE